MIDIPPPADTRSRILDAALDVFSEHGFEGSTLQQVADRLGFTKAALYYHFRSKDDILGALVAPASAGIQAMLEAHTGTPDSPARRRQRMEAILAGDDLDFADQVRVTIAFGGIQAAIARNPDAGTAELREALLAA